MSATMRLSSLLVLISSASFACAVEPDPEPDRQAGVWLPGAGALPGTVSRVLTSEVTGRDYEISVALPLGYETSASTYPVLYALDANGEFGTVVETARLLIFEGTVPNLIVVGIGYPVANFLAATPLRAVDLTPTEDADFVRLVAEQFPDLPPLEGSGGAPGFLEFLRRELVPLIESEFRADSTGRALFGHSFGGLFALYALFHGEGTFERVIAGSPSLFWDRRVTFDYEADYARTNDFLAADLLLAVGMLEAGQFDMVANVEEFAEVLESRGHRGLSISTAIFEDETHMSVVPATISRGLRSVYGATAR
jgi:predicted alpha/beta superfamily hydrolase